MLPKVAKGKAKAKPNNTPTENNQKLKKAIKMYGSNIDQRLLKKLSRDQEYVLGVRFRKNMNHEVKELLDDKDNEPYPLEWPNTQWTLWFPSRAKK